MNNLFKVLSAAFLLGCAVDGNAQEERTRQIHLDFHTSEMFPTVGNRWVKSEWQNTLKKGHVN